MPETSQFSQSSASRPQMGLSTKPSDLSESHDVHLLIVQDDEGRREVTLKGEVYSIGRDKKVDIRLASMFVSRQHATLIRRRREDGKYDYHIIDGNRQGQRSANGIVINGRKMPSNESHPLKDQDEVIFGPGVSVKYCRFKGEENKSGSLDDITLIDPGMIDDDDENSWK